jgi:hypothetical protein
VPTFQIDYQPVGRAPFRLERVKLMVAIVKNDIVGLWMSICAIENLGGSQPLCLQVGANQFRRYDPGGGKVNPRGFPAVAYPILGIFPQVVARIFGWGSIGHGKTLDESNLQIQKRQESAEKLPYPK